MSDAPGEAWRLRAEQALTHLRRYAVGADDDVDLVPRVVGEDELQGVALAIEAREAMVEGDRAGRERRLEHAMQVAAMDVDVGGAEAGLAGGIERELVQRGAGIGGAAHEGVRPDAHVEQPALESQAAEHLHDVGAQDDAGADAREGGRLLVDGDGEARALQEARAGQSAEARADDRDPVAAMQCCPAALRMLDAIAPSIVACDLQSLNRAGRACRSVRLVR